jgi:soluble lytic murein transglycosylase
LLGSAWVVSTKLKKLSVPDVVFPEKETPFNLDAIIEREADEFDLRPSLIEAVIERESSFNLNVPDGAAGEVGLMQITPIAWREYNRGNSGSQFLFPTLRKPEVNIHVGTWYLAWIRSALIKNGRTASDDLILQAYNGGIGNVLRGTVSSAAREYALKVLTLERKYA